MATSLTLENDSSLAQGYIKVNGSTAATLTTSGITGNLTGNADTATKFSTTTGSAPAYACRAWVNFDGTRDTTGAVSTANTNRFIRASGNVTSVLRNGTGDYTITFTTAMTDANYSASGIGMNTNSSPSNTGLGSSISFASGYTPSTSSVRVWSGNVTNSGTSSNVFQAIDQPYICFQVFGN